MTIRDRGNIKWTSMMLPEHVIELRKFINEDYYNIPEPTLDEQQLVEINTIILESMESNIPLYFKVYKNKRLIEIVGNVHYFDHIKQELRVIDVDSNLHIFATSCLKNVQKHDCSS
jgi:YolD-like protein